MGARENKCLEGALLLVQFLTPSSFFAPKNARKRLLRRLVDYPNCFSVFFFPDALAI